MLLYFQSIIRVGVGQSNVVKDVALETKVDQILADTDVGQLDKSIAGKRAVKMPSPLLVSRSCVYIAFLQVFE